MLLGHLHSAGPHDFQAFHPTSGAACLFRALRIALPCLSLTHHIC